MTAFTRIQELLDNHSASRQSIREAQLLLLLQRGWEDEGIFTFPKNIQEHLRTHVRVASCRNGVVTLEARDQQSAAAIFLQHPRLLKVLQARIPDVEVTKLTVRRKER